MVTIAILGILVALALPSFNTLIERFRVSRAQEDFASTYYFARSEAIRRGGAVVLQSGSGGCTPASTADWACGWTVFHDADGDGEQDADAAAEATLQTSVPAPGLQLTMRPARAAMTFDRWGFPATSRLFHLETRPRGADTGAAKSSCLVVSLGGRITRRKDQVSCVS